MKNIQNIKDLSGKKVLVRVDYNVPIKDGKVTDDERIKASFDTIDYLVGKGASVILIAHLGRPKGKIDPNFSLAPVAKKLEKLNKNFVQFIPETIGEMRDKALGSIMPGEVILLENLRFYPGEETNDEAFAKHLSRDCDYYVNDAFSASHRAHASIVGVTEFLPSFAGFDLQDEVQNLSKLLINPASPFVCISGGAKISDKIEVLKGLMTKIDVLLVGGGMANTFLCAEGLDLGCSFSEKDQNPSAKEILETADKEGVAVMLPEDAVVTKKVQENSKFEEKDVEDLEKDDIVADIGSNTILNFKDIIRDAGTIYWNGTLGINEYPEFNRANIEIGEAVAKSNAFTVIGGGDTAASLPQKTKEKIDFLSLAGGASMEFLEGKSLPGLEVLK